MLNDMITGLSSWGKALRLVASHGLWGYIFFPGMLSILVAMLLLLGGWELAAKIGPWIQGLYPAQWWGHDIVDNAAGILAFLLTLFFFALTPYVANYVTHHPDERHYTDAAITIKRVVEATPATDAATTN